MVGSSSPTTVLARSKIGTYCRISAALTSVCHDCKSCTDDRSPEFGTMGVLNSHFSFPDKDVSYGVHLILY